ncbi:hypothetical protein FQZ97_836620 [compost metagenome]
MFHGFVFLKSDQGAGGGFFIQVDVPGREAGEHAQGHLVLAGEFHRADLQHLAAHAGHLQHLFKAHAPEAARFGHDARIGGVDAVDVGVDQALGGLERGGHGHGRGVAAAATQRGDVAFGVHALEAGDDDDLAGGQVGADAHVVDRLDAGLGERAVGLDRHLPTGVAHRFQTLGLQRNGQQRRRSLLAGGGQHVEFAAVGGGGLARCELPGKAEQAVGLTAHGAGHHHEMVARAVPLGHAFGDVADALGRPHGGAAVLVNNQSHRVGLGWKDR